MTRRFLPCAGMLVSLVVGLPLAAQTTPANETMGINPAAKHPNSPAEPQTTVKTTTTTTSTHTRSMEHHRIHATSRGTVASRQGVAKDAARLATLLADSQGKVAVDAGAWKVMAIESLTLANRLVARTGGNGTARKAAIEARHHVRELRTAAMAGDAAGAKTHAAMALPFVYQLIDWSV